MVDYRGLIREFNAWGDANGNQDMVARMRRRALQDLLRDEFHHSRKRATCSEYGRSAG